MYSSKCYCRHSTKPRKKCADNYIKAPMKPERKPIDPYPNALPRKYSDENKWLWDMYQLLENKFKRGSEAS